MNDTKPRPAETERGYEGLSNQDKVRTVLEHIQQFEVSWPTTVDADFAGQLWAEYVNWGSDLGPTPRSNEDWLTVAPRIAMWIVLAKDPTEMFAGWGVE